MSKVYVLVAVQGEDPPEAPVLGVFSTEGAARSRKDDIDASAAKYRHRLLEAANEAIVRWLPWLDDVSKYRRANPLPDSRSWLLAAIGNRIRDRWYMAGVLERQDCLDHFLGEAIEVAGDGPKTPELQLVSPHDEPLFSHYEMSIQEMDFPELAHWKGRAIRAEKELDEICQRLRMHQNEAECELEKCGCCAATASELVADLRLKMS